MSHLRFEQQALLRALAARLTSPKPFAVLVPDDDAAVALVVDVVHGGCCCDCGGVDWQPWGARHLRCARCGVRPVFRRSPFATRHWQPRKLLAALHAIHVDTATPNAHAFARAWGGTPTRALDLLHELRAALRALVPPNAALVDVVLGGCNRTAIDVVTAPSSSPTVGHGARQMV